MNKKNFHILYKILDVGDYNNFVVFLDRNPKNPLIENPNNFIEDRIEGYSRLNKVRLRIKNKSEETYVQIYMHQKLYEFEIEENMSLKPVLLEMKCIVYDEIMTEFEYPLVITLVPDYEKMQNSWFDLGDNIENIICELNCYDVIFENKDKEYVVKSTVGVDKNLIPKKKNSRYGFIFYGNNFVDLYIWCQIKKYKPIVR